MSDFENLDKRFSFEDQIEILSRVLDQLIIVFTAWVDHFPEGREEEVLLDQWSLKDMLAHLSGWNLLTIEGLGLLQQGRADEIKPWFLDTEIDAFNAAEVEKRKSMSFEEVRKEMTETFDALIKAYKALTTDQWGSQLGSNPSRPIDSIQVDIDHIQQHTIQLISFYKSLIGK